MIIINELSPWLILFKLYHIINNDQQLELVSTSIKSIYGMMAITMVTTMKTTKENGKYFGSSVLTIRHLS